MICSTIVHTHSFNPVLSIGRFSVLAKRDHPILIMLSTFAIYTALSALVLGANGLPNYLEERQVPRPMRPYVQQGVAIYKCTQPNTIALTFDDGLTDLSESTITQLNDAGMKGTFFVNGDNYDMLRNHQSTLQRIVDSGHQVGSHT